MIYLIKSEENGMCKIGFSLTPELRLKSIQTSCPYKLELIIVIDGDIGIERQIHDKFISLKSKGEWFLYSDEIVDFMLCIDKNKAKNDLKSYISFNGLYDATSLLNWHNNMSDDKAKMVDYKKLKSTKEIIEYLKVNKETPILTSIKGTYMHRYLFVDFAMWINYNFRSKVIDWVYEGMDVNQSGDYYKEMCEALMNQRNVLQKQTSFFHYIQEANMLKELSGISNRNETTEGQLIVLNLLQKANIKMLNVGESKERRHSELLKLKNLVE